MDHCIHQQNVHPQSKSHLQPHLPLPACKQNKLRYQPPFEGSHGKNNTSLMDLMMEVDDGHEDVFFRDEDFHETEFGSCWGFLPFQNKPNNGQQLEDQQCQLFHLMQQKTTRQHNEGDGDGGGHKYVAEELSKLSIQQREEALQEVHGVVDESTKAEDPQMLAQCLTKLDEELDAHSTYSCAYQQALRMSSTYVQCNDFRLMFLRANEWNAKLAANRILRFLEEKLDLFGPERLTREIVLEDLDEDGDLTCVESGCIQRVPLQDRSGRDILAIYPRLFAPFAIRNVKKSIYYMTMSVALDNPRAQKLGVIEIEFGMGMSTFRSKDTRVMQGMVYTFRSLLPIRSGGAHVGTNDPTIHVLLDWGFRLLPSQMVPRIRVHHGTYLEIHYELLSYGIPVKTLPMNSSGEWGNDYHQTWIRKQREKESAIQYDLDSSMSTTSSSRLAATPPPNLPIAEFYGSNSAATIGMTLEPTSSDVVIGRGRVVDLHQGNVQFRNFLTQHAEDYEKLSSHKKRDFARKLLEHLRYEQGVRFLQTPSTVNGVSIGWKDVTENTEVLVEKISRTFRRFRERNTDRKDRRQRGKLVK